MCRVRLRVEYRWIEGSSWFVPSFLVFWSSVAVYVGYTWYQNHQTLVPMLCVLMVVAAVYYALALWVNKTVLTVSPERIDISHGPMPWFGGRGFDVSEIESISWEKRLDAQGMGTYIRFRIVLVGGNKVGIFPLLAIGRPEAALRALKRVCDWLGPFRNLDIREL